MTVGFFVWFDSGIFFFSWHSDYAKGHFKGYPGCVTAPSSEVKRNKSNFSGIHLY